MKRAHIVVVAVLVLTAVVVGVVYQMFLKERFDKYREDHTKLQQLIEKSIELDQKFKGSKPEAILDACKDNGPVWQEAISERATIFDMQDVFEVDPMPEGKWPKFWYEEEFQKRVQAFQLAAFEKRVAIPDTTFGAPPPQQLVDVNVTEEQATEWLKQFQLGAAGVQLLLDANVLQIDEAVLYPVRKEHEVLDSYGHGFEFYMYLKDLSKLLHDLSQRDDKYFNVQGIRVRNGQLRSYDNPPLHVEMLLARAGYDDTAAVLPLRAVDESGRPDIWLRVEELEDEDEEDEEFRREFRKPPWYLRIWSIVGL